MQELATVLPNASIGQGYGQSHSLFYFYSRLGSYRTGLTETCTTIAMIPPTQNLATVGSAGQLLPGIIAKVVKPNGSLAIEGEQGELVVTGPSMALGYLDNDVAYVKRKMVCFEI